MRQMRTLTMFSKQLAVNKNILSAISDLGVDLINISLISSTDTVVYCQVEETSHSENSVYNC